MYKITGATKREAVYAALSLPDRVFKQRITFGHYTSTLGVRTFVSDKEIAALRSLEVSQEANGSLDGISIGNACSSSFSADFYNDDKTFNYSDKTVFVECGIRLADGTFYYIPCGYFNCEKIETDDDGKTLSISGYDDISKMTAKWTPGIALTDSTSLLDIVADIANRYGLTVVYVDALASSSLKNHLLTADDAQTLAAYTEREVLGFCAGCAGMNARINTVGDLSISWFFEPDSAYAVPITADIQWSGGFKKTNDAVFTVESMTSGVDENIYTKGTGAGISFANPLITSAEIDLIYGRYVAGRTSSWQPSECEWRGNPCVEAGDIVTVADKDGVEHTIYIATQSLDLTGGLKSDVVCPRGDVEISFETTDSNTQLELKRLYNNMQQAIKDATAAINGANGGYYRVLDMDGDGNPDGWECFAPDGLNGVRCTYGGIGVTADGGKTYSSAMTGKGLVGNSLTVGQIIGANDLFFIDLETGKCRFFDIDITGGNIELDGGRLSTATDGWKADLSAGYLELSQALNEATGTSNKYLTAVSTSLLWYNYENFTHEVRYDSYATFASPQSTLTEPFSGGEINLGVGFRFGESAENGKLYAGVKSDFDPGVYLTYCWLTDYLLIEKNRLRVRSRIEVNEAGFPTAPGEYLSVCCFGSTSQGMFPAETGASSILNNVPAWTAKVSDSSGSVLARLDVFSAQADRAEIRLRNATDSYRITCKEDGMYFWSAALGAKKIAFV